MQEEEIFVDIKNFEGKYHISNFGNVKSLCGVKERMLKGFINNCGYSTVNLYFLNSKIKSFLIHRLVAEHFIENPENKSCVDHIDGNILNNKLSNLRWATHGENMHNQKIPINNTTGFKGVTYYKPNKKFAAKIAIDNKNYHLGYFKTAKEASDVYDAKAKEIFGDFYRAPIINNL